MQLIEQKFPFAPCPASSSAALWWKSSTGRAADDEGFEPLTPQPSQTAVFSNFQSKIVAAVVFRTTGCKVQVLYKSNRIVLPNIHLTCTLHIPRPHVRNQGRWMCAGVYNERSDPAHKSTPSSPAFHNVEKPGRGSHQGQIKFSVFQNRNLYYQSFLGWVGEAPTLTHW